MTNNQEKGGNGNVTRIDKFSESSAQKKKWENQERANRAKEIHDVAQMVMQEELITRNFLKDRGSAAQLEITNIRNEHGASLSILGDLMEGYSTLTDLFHDCQSGNVAAVRLRALNKWIDEKFAADIAGHRRPIVFHDENFHEMTLAWRTLDE